MDLVTFGEAMVRLTPPGSQRLEQTRSFDAYVGGGELNVAVAAARLGVCAAGPATLMVMPPVSDRRPLVSVTGEIVRPMLRKTTELDPALT